MQTVLPPTPGETPEGREAKNLLRSCVHCGFCTATCPTYQLTGNELDSPRGRIHLIKQVIEGARPTRVTQRHLDRCLTCRNCETTCPSGVEYGRLIDIGRQQVQALVDRPVAQRLGHWLLKRGIASPLFGLVLKAGQFARPLLPQALRRKIPRRLTPLPWPGAAHTRHVLLLPNCVQPALNANIDTATAIVLDAAGIGVARGGTAQCCGALAQHLNDAGRARDRARRNIDRWWPAVADGKIEALISNVSGCGLMVKDYGHLLRDDPHYADRAARISALTQDISELMPDILNGLRTNRPGQAASLGAGLALHYHPPCTLQHGQKLPDQVLPGLNALGFKVEKAQQEAHLCCGSAGTYSLTQPALARQLRDRKLANLAIRPGATIISANIGCIAHLQSGTDTPVRHWVEVLADALLERRGETASPSGQPPH